MDLYVMRHADAEDGTGNDFTRVLSEKGRSQAEKMGSWLKAIGPGPLSVVTSPFPRARETAQIVADQVDSAIPVRQDERLASGMRTDTGSSLLHEYGKDGEALLMVGHAPDLANLVAYLLGAKDGTVELRKGAVASLEVGRAGFGGSMLRWLITPKL